MFVFVCVCACALWVDSESPNADFGVVFHFALPCKLFGGPTMRVSAFGRQNVLGFHF